MLTVNKTFTTSKATLKTTLQDATKERFLEQNTCNDLGLA